MESLVLFKPALHPFMFVRRVVVADQVDLFSRRNGLIDHAQEAEPFLMAMPLLAETVDFSGCRIESGEQRGRAVALVVVRHGGAAAFLHREGRVGGGARPAVRAGGV